MKISSLGLHERLDLSLALAMMNAIALFFWGTAFNAAVVIANGGSMPVTHDDIIINIVSSDGRARHSARENEARLTYLTDRLTIRFPAVTIPDNSAGDVLHTVAKLVDYPVEGGLNIVSVGDLLRWMGTGLGLIMLPLLLIRILFRLPKERIRFER